MAGSGYRDWVAGEKPTAAQFDTFLQHQTVMVFASAAARNAALAAVLAEGMVTYLLDSNTLTVYSGAAWSTVGPVHGALSSWTPAITQSGAVTCTVSYAAYQRLGRGVNFQCLLTVTGAGTVSNAVVVTLPLTANGALTTQSAIGTGHIFDTTAGTAHFCELRLNAGSASIRFQSNGTTDGTFWGASPATALASGDIISMNGWYEVGADA